jgi:hypothetical protein
MVSKRRGSKYRSGHSINWLKVSYTVDEFELLGVEREAGKPAFALMGEIGTRKYVGSAFHQFHPRDPMEARPGARRAGAEGDEAAGDAMGQARADRSRQAPARRGRPSGCLATGFWEERGRTDHPRC